MSQSASCGFFFSSSLGNMFLGFERMMEEWRLSGKVALEITPGVDR